MMREMRRSREREEGDEEEWEDEDGDDRKWGEGVGR